MNSIEYVLDNLGRPVDGYLPSTYTLEELENGNSSSAGVGWIGLVDCFKVNCPHMRHGPTEGVPSVEGVSLRDPSPYLSTNIIRSAIVCKPQKVKMKIF